MDTIIIKGCLNGSRGREHNPNVPWTPEEVAQEAVRCYEAGASIVHIHARTPDGGISYDPAWYAQTDAMIRAQCDLVLNHTTARQAHVPVEAVTRYLLETPQPVEMVSLNLGMGVRWAADPETGRRRTVVSPNSFEDITATLDACYQRGTFPEPAVHDMGDVNNAFTLMQEGYIKDTRYFLVEPGRALGRRPAGHGRFAAQLHAHRRNHPRALPRIDVAGSQQPRADVPAVRHCHRHRLPRPRRVRGQPVPAQQPAAQIQRRIHRVGSHHGPAARARAGDAAAGAGHAGAESVP